MKAQHDNAVSGTIYMFLGLSFVSMAFMAVSYLLDPTDALRPFWNDNAGLFVSRHQAATAILPLGLLLGPALLTFGLKRAGVRLSATPAPKLARVAQTLSQPIQARR